MANLEPTKQRRGLVAIDGAMALIGVLLVVKLWLLSTTLEAFLAGRRSPVVAAAIVSGLQFAAYVALNLFIDRVDRESRRP